ncbi:hypothetical protein ABWL39_04815 [Chitinivorax sp. PXF-14]|uniref:RipA family octameric membrane protein n=1 Tax=Chitinivorax sp. PXF-14 TaxID=3230488 RepID=UPI003465B5C5
MEKKSKKDGNEGGKDGQIIIANATPSSDTEDLIAIKALFELTLELRNFEISQLVQRNNFFMIFQGVLLAGVVQSSHTKPVVSFLVCLAGLIVSIYQTRMAAGAKFWQDYWQEALVHIEKIMLGGLFSSKKRRIFVHLFHQDDDQKTRMVKKQLGDSSGTIVGKMILKRYSVSQIPIYVGIALSAIWLFLTLCTLRGYPPLGIPSFIVGF